jgi:hypothetical protein
LFLYPGLALLIGGLLGFVLLEQNTIGFVSHRFGINSLLYMAASTILGMQLVQLAVLTQWMAILARVVPAPQWYARISPILKVEVGLVFGAAMALAGLLWSYRLLLTWGGTGFGELDPTNVMRSAIPAVTLMIVGAQGAAGALFAGAIESCWQSSSDRT